MGSLEKHNRLIDIVEDYLKDSDNCRTLRELEYELLGKHGEADLLYIDWEKEKAYNYEIKCSPYHRKKAYSQLEKNMELLEKRYGIDNIESYFIYYIDEDKETFAIERYG